MKQNPAGQIHSSVEVVEAEEEDTKLVVVDCFHKSQNCCFGPGRRCCCCIQQEFAVVVEHNHIQNRKVIAVVVGRQLRQHH